MLAMHERLAYAAWRATRAELPGAVAPSASAAAGTLAPDLAAETLAQRHLRPDRRGGIGDLIGAAISP